MALLVTDAFHAGLTGAKSNIPRDTPVISAESPIFEEAYSFTKAQERGYVNHPDDNGGATNHGISQKAYPHINIKGLSAEKAKNLYKRDYWDKIRGDVLPTDLSKAIFDTAVNAGVDTASKHLQLEIGAKADGVIGPRTLKKLRQYLESNSSYDLTMSLLDKREWYYRRLAKNNPNQQKFLGNWLNRTSELRKLIQADQYRKTQEVMNEIGRRALQ